MDLQLKGKTAIVTGATAGIGLAIARTLANEGVAVTMTGRNRDKLDTAIADIVAAVPGAQLTPVIADLSTAEGAAAVIQARPDADILVNNLGMYEAKAFAEISDEDWRQMFEINVMSGVRLSRHYFAGMLERNWGRVIFISSEVGAFTPPDMVHYGVTKSAQLAVSRGMAELTKGTGVTVNSVLPAATRSDGIVEYLRQTAPRPGMTDAQIEAHFFQTYRPSSLIARMIEADEVAAMVALLASPLGAASNGAAVRVEGGSFRSIL
ncbi:3-oxoacyl-[acyl-carrier-protein] reductase FabG [Ralstonia mannitolilytica]|uniref:SDR family NAD(P)-dependent oxidoreductase n=1 Tax=Ralstonia mannitolilytica TaxID=105219 RepID=UPI0007AFFF4E|nr:SDR family NAD(P)-dependent oxidoreductase [Ralstonia mannitolilytica]ANA35087.1 oxidoreductase [Ralstonia mannitolilytica]CAJ0684396.1 3-oxoacyl-[acyl-carrier-protein] reductase FabG [Ralstonia mannitolilytica]CAJ0736898.1 3-oxoacyl-[acyl-carrier-protein] reductase FabG [Ralstonia mannitolilytica]CAJ0864243.1 3-oxoacyl-[acyl-carrier-protein] reductase FabG [Ralstonia mannitolilytica]